MARVRACAFINLSRASLRPTPTFLFYSGGWKAGHYASHSVTLNACTHPRMNAKKRTGARICGVLETPVVDCGGSLAVYDAFV